MKIYEFLMKTYESFKSGKKFKIYAGRDWKLTNELKQLLWHKSGTSFLYDGAKHGGSRISFWSCHRLFNKKVGKMKYANLILLNLMKKFLLKIKNLFKSKYPDPQIIQKQLDEIEKEFFRNLNS